MISSMTTAERKAAILEALAGLRDDQALDVLDSTKNTIVCWAMAGKLGNVAPKPQAGTVDAIRDALSEGSPA